MGSPGPIKPPRALQERNPLQKGAVEWGSGHRRCEYKLAAPVPFRGRAGGRVLGWNEPGFLTTETLRTLRKARIIAKRRGRPFDSPQTVIIHCFQDLPEISPRSPCLCGEIFILMRDAGYPCSNIPFTEGRNRTISENTPSTVPTGKNRHSIAAITRQKV